MSKLAICVVILCSSQFSNPPLVVKYSFPLTTIRVTGIFAWAHSWHIMQHKTHHWLKPMQFASTVAWPEIITVKGGNHLLSIGVTYSFFNTLRRRQNCRHFPDDIFKFIFLNENEWISIRISLKFAPKGQINNIPSLFQIMAWRRRGDKPLSEAMMVSLLTQICVTRPQWVDTLRPRQDGRHFCKWQFHMHFLE